jgi:hypothetical protein
MQQAVRMNITEQINKSPLGWILAVIGFVSAPISFLTQTGLTWLFLCAAIALWIWWWQACFLVRMKPSFIGPAVRIYSPLQLFLWALWPTAAVVAFVVMLTINIYGLDVWRKEYDQKSVDIERAGSINTHFALSPRTTPLARTISNRNQWVRWMWDGVNLKDKTDSLLFVESKPFTNMYQTFNLEVFDNGNQATPNIDGVAFLVSEKGGDPWYRPVFRQIPCETSGDLSGKLATVTVSNPESGERLWIFLSVKSKTPNIDTLNLSLTVQP